MNKYCAYIQQHSKINKSFSYQSFFVNVTQLAFLKGGQTDRQTDRQAETGRQTDKY